MAGIVLVQTTVTVEILDKMVSLSAEALQAQELLIVHNMTLLAYDPCFMSIGLALYHVNTTSQARTQLAQYIKGLWLVKFLNYLLLLREQIFCLIMMSVSMMAFEAGFITKM